MKIGILKSIAHNIADSLSSGIGFMIGVYSTDVYGEAACSPGGHISIDFLTGEVIAGAPSSSLCHAVKLYSAALPDLCQKHGADISDYHKLQVRFGTNIHHQQRFIVTVESKSGKSSADTYYGSPGAKSKITS